MHVRGRMQTRNAPIERLRGTCKPCTKRALVYLRGSGSRRFSGPRGSGSKQCPNARGERHGESTPERDAQCAYRDACAASMRGQPSEKREEKQGASRNEVDETRYRDYCSDQQRHGCPDSEAGGRGQRSLHRTRAESLGDTEFIAGMRAQRVMGHQLLGDLIGEGTIEPASDVDRRQFLVLTLVVFFEFRAFKVEVGLFDVRL